MSGFEHSHAIRSDLLAKAQQSLALAEHQSAVIETVRQTARAFCKSDGIALVLRDGDMCHYVEEDAISPLWKGMRFPMSACISGWSMLHAETAVIEDIYKDDRIPHDAYRPTFVKSLIMTPVMKPPVAAIGAYWRDKRKFTEREILAIKTLSVAVGRALAEYL